MRRLPRSNSEYSTTPRHAELPRPLHLDKQRQLDQDMANGRSFAYDSISLIGSLELGRSDRHAFTCEMKPERGRVEANVDRASSAIRRACPQRQEGC